MASLLHHLRLGAREDFRVLHTGFADEHALSLRLQASPRSWFQAKVSQVLGRIALPSRTWEHGLAANDDMYFALSFVMRVCAAINVFWGIVFHWLFPYAFGAFHAFALSNLCIIGFASVVLLWYGVVVSKQTIRWWIERRLRRLESSGGSDDASHYSVPVLAFWQLCGWLSCPQYIALVLCVGGIGFSFAADALTRFSTELLPALVCFPLAAGALLGGKEMLSFVLVVCVLFASVAFATWISPTGRLTQETSLSPLERAFIEGSTSITTMLFVAEIQDILRSRILRMEQDTASWAAKLLWDLRTPLHGIIGGIQEVVDIGNVGLACRRPCVSSPCRAISGGLTASNSSILLISRPARQYSEPNFVHSIPSPTKVIAACAATVHLVLENVCRVATIEDIAVDAESGRQSIELALLAERVFFLLASSARPKKQITEVKVNNAVVGSSKMSCGDVQIKAIGGTRGDLLQIILNLLANACKFSPISGTIRVRIALRATVTANLDLQELSALVPASTMRPSLLTVEVEDSGPGVLPAHRQAIFELYERGSKSLGTGGSGLGLYVASACARRLKGSLTCCGRSDGLSGARFILEVPCLSKAPRPEGQTQQEIYCRNREKKKLFVPERMGKVLIVDDNALNVRILRQLLVRIGFCTQNVVHFASAEEALEALHYQPIIFGVAILDLLLPGMDGIELTRHILTQQHDLRAREHSLHEPPLIVVAATATASNLSIREWKAAGAAIFMPKPFGKDKLIAVLQAASRLQEPRAAVAVRTEQFTETTELPTKSKPRHNQDIFRLRMRVLILNGIPLIIGLFLAGQTAVGVYVCAFVIILMALLQSWGRSWLRGREMSIAAIAFALIAFFGTIHYWCTSRAISALVVLVTSWHSRVTLNWILAAICFEIATQLLSLSVPDAFCTVPRPSRPILLLLDTCIMLNMASLFLIQLSFAAQARKERELWVHTLNHDMIIPLHGILAAVQDLEANQVECHGIDAVATCASALMATVDTTLQLTQQSVNVQLGRLSANARRQQPILVKDVALFCRKHAVMLIERRFLDSCSFDDAAIDRRRLAVPRLAMLFVLSKFLSFIPLHRSVHGVVSVRMTIETDQSSEVQQSNAFGASLNGRPVRLLVEASEAINANKRTRTSRGRQQTPGRRHDSPNGVDLPSVSERLGAFLSRGRTELDSEMPSYFGQALAHLVHGRIEFIKTKNCPGDLDQKAWKLSLVVPTLILPAALNESMSSEE